jgi:hypothetical protein
MNYWIGVVSHEHVQRGVAGGFVQINHGKLAPLRKMKADDGLVFYSPRESHPNGALRHYKPSLQLGSSVLEIPMHMTCRSKVFQTSCRGASTLIFCHVN